ncbi:MAG: ergothioneine biosynthesis protein EgtB [Herminiimonas sp.]|nr:ergothioneine biosynthesis protein EgtB [Herminiimonas sp.]
MTLQATQTGFVEPSLIAGVQERFDEVRRHSVKLGEPLSEEDCCAQSMPDASPLKWHLAHTTWFFETFILERYERNFSPSNPAFRVLFNSYYNGVGEKHPRAQRGLLTRPSLDEVLSYRHQVDNRIAALLHGDGDLAPIVQLIHLGLHHEQQHQELMVTDVMHLLSMNPLKPAYDTRLPLRHAAPPPLAWRSVESGVVHIGHDAVVQDGFCFDNETPRHRQFVEPFALAQRLITNGEYLQFVQAGGYENPSLWMSEGWEWIRSQGIRHPLYWQSADENRWQEFTLHGMQPLDLAAPASHLSWFEADAYARSVEARLPTEAEWECAVTQAAQPAGPNAQGGQPDLQQVFGACWQWTSSSYAPYPGFAPAGGAIGEYNGKFMCNQHVLRGSSCATPAGHSRASYRNFFPATARWQFSGIRLAKSLG